MSSGVQLKKELGLEKFKYSYIQRVLDSPLEIYVITVDSKYPHFFLSRAKMDKILSSFTRRSRSKPGKVNLKKLRLSIPVELEEYGPLASNAIIFFRDIAGEYFGDRSLYEVK